MVTITDHTSLEKWLQGRETQVAAVIAVRAALRVLPLISENWRGGEADAKNTTIIVPVLRATLVSRVVTLAPTVETKAAADAAATAAAVGGDTYARAAAAATRAAAAYARAAYAAAAATAAATFVGAAAEFWKAVSDDCTLMGDGKEISGVLTRALWLGAEYPHEIDRAWLRLQAYFNLDGSTWGFWRDWYQKVLDGQHQRSELLLEIALLPNEDWEAGPERIAERIAGLQAKHIPLSYPMAERVEFNAATAKLRVVPTPPPEPRLFAMGLQKVRDEIAEFADIDPKSNQYTALKKVLEKLGKRVDHYKDDPQRINDELLSAMASIQYLIDENEITDDVAVQALLRAFDTTCLDIRSTMDAVNATYIRRVDMRLVEMAEDKKETLVLVSAIVAGAAEDELYSQPPIDANVVTGRVTIDLDTSLAISKADRVVALERTRHRLPTALETMRDKGIEVGPRAVKGLRDGWTLGEMLMALIEILRGLKGL